MVGRGRDPKLLLLFGLLLCAAVGYALTVATVWTSGQVSEKVFDDVQPRGDARVGVYVEIISIDAVNDSLRLRISVTDARTATAAEGVSVRLDSADVRRDIVLRGPAGTASETIDINLDDGTVAAFPFDRFRATLRVRAAEAVGTAATLRATAWEGIAGWVPAIARDASAAPGDITLSFALRRSGPVRLLVLAVYGEMALIGLAALTIGCRIFMGLRPPESTLTGALTGMVFSLPALRYALPGSVPLGVRADLLVFFWAELAVALGFSLFVVTWARARAKP